MDGVPLRSCRQFVMDTVVLSATNLKETDKNIELKIEQLLVKRVEKLVAECASSRYCYDKQPVKPLVRIKVDYTNFETVNENRFAQKMMDKVANPRNVLQFFKLLSSHIYIIFFVSKHLLNIKFNKKKRGQAQRRH